jgi:hypothetical protein
VYQCICDHKIFEYSIYTRTSRKHLYISPSPHRRSTSLSLYSIASLATLRDLILSLAAIEWLFIPPKKALVASLGSTLTSSRTLPPSLDRTLLTSDEVRWISGRGSAALSDGVPEE